MIPQNGGIVLIGKCYTPIYTPNHIKLAIDKDDCIRHKKELKPFGFKLFKTL